MSSVCQFSMNYLPFPATTTAFCEDANWHCTKKTTVHDIAVNWSEILDDISAWVVRNLCIITELFGIPYHTSYYYPQKLTFIPKVCTFYQTLFTNLRKCWLKLGVGFKNKKAVLFSFWQCNMKCVPVLMSLWIRWWLWVSINIHLSLPLSLWSFIK